MWVLDVAIDSRHYLNAAQPVLIEVVSVYLILAECGVGIAFPATAEVQLVEDTSDAETT